MTLPLFQSNLRGDGTDEPRVPRRIAVIGAGVTGLAAANRLLELQSETGRPIEVVLFEGSDRVGGVFGTERIGDYLVERGADSFITTKPAALALTRRLGLENRVVSTNSQYRSSLIVSRGKPVATPKGFNLVAPGDLGAIMRTPLLSWAGKLRVLAEPLVPRRTDPSDESVASFVRRRMGREALDRLVQPLVGGIYTSDPEVLSAQTTLARFVAMERDYGSLYRGLRASPSHSEGGGGVSGARYGLFVSFRDGMQELLSGLEHKVRLHARVQTHSPVKSLRREGQEWILQTGAAAERFHGVVVCLSAPSAARLLQSVSPDCALPIGEIPCASSAIVVTGHALADIQHPLDAFGLVVPHREGRKILATSFLSRKFDNRAPAGRVCLRTFVGGAMQPEEYEKSDDEIVKTVLSELKSILGVNGKPDFAVVCRYGQAMPQFHVGHAARVQEIRRRAESLGTVVLAGNYFDGVGVPDCVQSGEQAAELLLQRFESKKPETVGEGPRLSG